MDEIRPGSALGSAIPGAVSIVAASYLSGWLADCLLALGVLLAVYSLAIIIIWAVERIMVLANDRRKAIAEAEAVTPEILLIQAKHELAESINLLNPTALEILAHRTGIFIPEYDLFEEEAKVGGVEWWFWCEFLRNTSHDGISDKWYLCPVSRWSSGSKEQMKAQRITAYLVTKRLAVAPRDDDQWLGGNKPAEWLSQDAYYKTYRYFMQTNEDPA
jgi:hypothetical protein